MNVYCYYQELNFADQTDQRELWAKSWSLRGFTPTVLTIEDAKKSTLFERYNEAVGRAPTQNHRGYSTANFLRYAALESVGGGLLTDYDVINYALHPDNLWWHFQLPFARMHVGGFVHMQHKTVQRFIENTIGFINNGNFSGMELFGKPHFSDVDAQNVFCGEHRQGVCLLYREYGWWNAPTVHYSNDSVIGIGVPAADKAKHIMQVRPV